MGRAFTQGGFFPAGQETGVKSGWQRDNLGEGFIVDKTVNSLLVIASVGLAVSAVLFIAIAIFSSTESDWVLPAGLFCCALSNLFNLIRSMLAKSK